MPRPMELRRIPNQRLAVVVSVAHGNQLPSLAEGWMLSTPASACWRRRLAAAVPGNSGRRNLHRQSELLSKQTIGLFTIHPSIRVGWAMDSTPWSAAQALLWNRRREFIRGRLRVSWVIWKISVTIRLHHYLDVMEDVSIYRNPQGDYFAPGHCPLTGAWL
jgi:hypothetical protein